MRPLKILHTINVPWYNAVAWYGVSTALAQQRLGHAVYIVGDPKSPVLHKAEELGIRHLYKLPLSSPNPFTQAGNFLRMKKLIESKAVDVVNAHQGNGYYFIAMSALKARQCPVLVRTRGDIRWPNRNYFNRKLYSDWSHGIIATSSVTYDRMTQTFPIHKTSIRVIYPSVDKDLFHPNTIHPADQKKALGIESHVPVFGLIGRIDRKKGHRVALLALKRILEKGHPARLIIAGKENDMSYGQLKNFAASLGIEHSVSFLGYVPDVKHAMGACDCGLIASTASEAICRVGLEFMALGIPVIASHFHGIPDIVKHQENGLLFKVGSDADLSQAMELFLSCQERWRAMGDKGRVMVEETFHLQQMGSCSLDFYSQLMEKRHDKG